MTRPAILLLLLAALSHPGFAQRPIPQDRKSAPTLRTAPSDVSDSPAPGTSSPEPPATGTSSPCIDQLAVQKLRFGKLLGTTQVPTTVWPISQGKIVALPENNNLSTAAPIDVTPTINLTACTTYRFYFKVIGDLTDGYYATVYSTTQNASGRTAGAHMAYAYPMQDYSAFKCGGGSHRVALDSHTFPAGATCVWNGPFQDRPDSSGTIDLARYGVYELTVRPTEAMVGKEFTATLSAQIGVTANEANQDIWESRVAHWRVHFLVQNNPACNQPPIFAPNSPNYFSSDYVLESERVPVSCVYSATDPEGQAVTFSLEFENNTPAILPNVSITPGGQFSWDGAGNAYFVRSTTCPYPSSLKLRVVATDAFGAKTKFPITLTYRSGPYPVCAPPPNSGSGN